MLFANRLRPRRLFRLILRKHSTQQLKEEGSTVINNSRFPVDDYTNVTPKVLSLLGKKLHNKQCHPLNLMKQRIVNYFYSVYKGRTGNPIFSVFDDLNPVVSIEQNFDSLLIPEDHVSRKKSDCFYLNRNYLLRAHMTAHQTELIKMGLDNFLMLGDVYRRDEIDSTHYPVFHQCDAVRLFHREQLAEGIQAEIFEKGASVENEDKQKEHTIIASREVEQQLKSTLEGLARHIFGKDTECRWVGAYFPFTHPSWELEVKMGEEWIEVLGCGIIRHSILEQAGARDRLGWAFGLGLDRLAMILHSIPDIRFLWSEDPGFWIQFQNKTVDDKIIFKAVSVYPPCKADISFWIPKHFEENDFYSLARDIGGDLIEQVNLVDKFTHPKTGRTSHCYRIVYRDLERTLTQEEVNQIHVQIGSTAEKTLGVEVR